MLFTSALLAIAAATSTTLAAPSVEKRQYTGQPGYPQAIVFVESYNTPDRTSDTFSTVKIPLGYGLNSTQVAAFKKASYISLAGAIGNVDPTTVDCVTDKGVHFNSKTPLAYSNTSAEVGSILCRQAFFG